MQFTDNDPGLTNPGILHSSRIAHLAQTMCIRARHMREMRRDGWRYVPNGAGVGFALVPPFVEEINKAITEAIDDFEITEG